VGAEASGETREMEVQIESGEIKEIVCIFD